MWSQLFRIASALCMSAGVAAFVNSEPLAAQQRRAPAAPQRRAPAVSVSKLTTAQFMALRDDQLIESRGTVMTKREFVAMVEAARVPLRQRAPARRPDARLPAGETFRRQEQARIERENAIVLGRLAAAKEGRAQNNAVPDNVRLEARKLQQQIAAARTDAERAQIERRARQLLRQLSRR